MTDPQLMSTVLVVDAANVIGSVPDGWWQDRAGAAARLHAALTRAALRYDQVILVLEGKARAGVAAGVTHATKSSLSCVHAQGEGDDEIVDQCRAAAATGTQVTLATADRGLIARVEPLAVTIVGPRSIPRR